MTQTEKKVIEQMRELSEQRPETRQPDHAFVRDWAFGNAGLEDERITIDQVENVLSKQQKK